MYHSRTLFEEGGMRKPMVEVSATVPAAPDSVFAQVIEVVKGAGGGRFEVDRERRTVAVQGGWWYRGEYQVDPAGDGSRLTHRVRNVATRGRWAVPLANRFFIGFRAATERGFAALVAHLSAG
jgi:hypothetical protein